MKFLVADDHELIRQGVKGMLRGLDADAQFDEADTWETLAAAARPDADHDLAIVDLHMPGMSGASSMLEFGDLDVVVHGQIGRAHV